MPALSKRLQRLFLHDTSFARGTTSFGLVILGLAMLFNFGSGAPGYSLMSQALPLPFWGLLYLGVGVWGLYGTVNRFPYWIRILHVVAAMYLWAFITVAQFNDQFLPTRALLILPALVDLWVLVKVVLIGPRRKKDQEC